MRLLFLFQNQPPRAQFYYFHRVLWRRASPHTVNRCTSKPSTPPLQPTNIDKASRVLSQGVPPSIPHSYQALADHGNVPKSTLHRRTHGQRSIKEKAQSQQYLTVYEEDALAKFILQLADLRQPVRIKFLPSLAFYLARHRIESSRPSKPPGKNQAKAFQDRHPEVRARTVKALDQNRHEKNIYNKVTQWFDVVKRVLRNPAILAENIYNIDKTGVILSILGSIKVLLGKNDIRTYREARIKRKVVTAIEYVSANSRYLNPIIIQPATTHRSNQTTFPTPRQQYALSESRYTDSYLSLQWLKRIFDPKTKERAQHKSRALKPRVLIYDGFSTHETLKILEFCLSNNIILCRLPSHTSHKLQPCDVSTFSPLKTAYREQVERLERGGVNTVGKKHFIYLYSPARSKAFTPRNIKAGFTTYGLFPFNPDRVLKTMPKPPPKLITPKADGVTVGPCRPVETSLPQDAVQSPKTPVTAEGLISL